MGRWDGPPRDLESNFNRMGDYGTIVRRIFDDVMPDHGFGFNTYEFRIGHFPTYRDIAAMHSAGLYLDRVVIDEECHTVYAEVAV